MKLAFDLSYTPSGEYITQSLWLLRKIVESDDKVAASTSVSRRQTRIQYVRKEQLSQFQAGSEGD
jgi:hypothetical protein